MITKLNGCTITHSKHEGIQQQCSCSELNPSGGAVGLGLVLYAGRSLFYLYLVHIFVNVIAVGHECCLERGLARVARVNLDFFIDGSSNRCRTSARASAGARLECPPARRSPAIHLSTVCFVYLLIFACAMVVDLSQYPACPSRQHQKNIKDILYLLTF